AVEADEDVIAADVALGREVEFRLDAEAAEQFKRPGRDVITVIAEGDRAAKGERGRSHRVGLFVANQERVARLDVYVEAERRDVEKAAATAGRAASEAAEVEAAPAPGSFGEIEIGRVFGQRHVDRAAERLALLIAREYELPAGEGAHPLVHHVHIGRRDVEVPLAGLELRQFGRAARLHRAV